MIRGFGLGYWNKCLLSLFLEFRLALVLLDVQCHHSPFFALVAVCAEQINCPVGEGIGKG
jgi:hypothetical protein